MKQQPNLWSPWFSGTALCLTLGLAFLMSPAVSQWDFRGFLSYLLFSAAILTYRLGAR